MDKKLVLKLEEIGWTSAEFARRVGVTPTTVSRWKRAPQWAMAYCELALVLVKAARGLGVKNGN